MALYFRYMALYKDHLYDKFFTKTKVVFTFLILLTYNMLIFTVFILFDGLGFNDMGVCAVVTKTLFLKIYFQFILSLDVVSYSISSFCAWKVLKKVRAHTSGISSDFVVSI